MHSYKIQVQLVRIQVATYYYILFYGLIAGFSPYTEIFWYSPYDEVLCVEVSLYTRAQDQIPTPNDLSTFLYD